MLLYTISGAPRGWRVQMALMFKGLDYELRVLEASTKEHKRQPYLGVNPRGAVPTLEHEGDRITDSLGIMAWLDRAFPARPLFGETPRQAGAIWSLSTDLEDHMRPAHHAFVFPILVERRTISSMTDAERSDMARAAERLISEFDHLESRFGDCPFLFGETPSAADAVAYPDARLVQRMNETFPDTAAAFGFDRFEERFPNIAAWKAHISRLPEFERCLPQHWSKRAA